ncbi:MAG TPA: sulfate adenylyltransferase, partial [Thermoplasmatales archaeon]|nr:sulfate adenylyltransferase [Thermoplasmatales archaeon]
MSKPHGGKLINRCVFRDVDLNDANVVRVNADRAEDIENIAHGVFSPLEGFLCRNDLESVLDDKRLDNDIPWTIPILLDLDEKELAGAKEGDTIFLTHENGMVSEMEIEEIYTIDKKKVAEKVYGTTDPSHPGVSMTFNMKDLIIGGRITLLKEGKKPFDEFLLWPKETRILFREKGWKEIVAFQTRNPPHIGHEYVQKTALTFVDGIFINPIIGKKKKGDFKDEVILKSYDALI